MDTINRFKPIRFKQFQTNLTGSSFQLVYRANLNDTDWIKPVELNCMKPFKPFLNRTNNHLVEVDRPNRLNRFELIELSTTQYY